MRDAPAEQEANAPQKASAKGAEARSVAAAITDPVDARVNGAKICKPTVSGRMLSELVMIRGQEF